MGIGRVMFRAAAGTAGISSAAGAAFLIAGSAWYKANVDAVVLNSRNEDVSKLSKVSGVATPILGYMAAGLLGRVTTWSITALYGRGKKASLPSRKKVTLAIMVPSYVLTLKTTLNSQGASFMKDHPTQYVRILMPIDIAFTKTSFSLKKLYDHWNTSSEKFVNGGKPGPWIDATNNYFKALNKKHDLHIPLLEKTEDMRALRERWEEVKRAASKKVQGAVLLPLSQRIHTLNFNDDLQDYWSNPKGFPSGFFDDPILMGYINKADIAELIRVNIFPIAWLMSNCGKETKPMALGNENNDELCTFWKDEACEKMKTALCELLPNSDEKAQKLTALFDAVTKKIEAIDSGVSDTGDID
jgi:hypothetical protein